MITGAGLLLLAGAVAAQQSGTPVDQAVYVRDVAAGAVGIVMLLFGFLGTRLHNRVDKLEDDAAEVFSKDETRQMITDLLAPLDERSRTTLDAVSAVHRRLDQLAVPHARTGQP